MAHKRALKRRGIPDPVENDDGTSRRKNTQNFLFEKLSPVVVIESLASIPKPGVSASNSPAANDKQEKTLVSKQKKTPTLKILPLPARATRKDSRRAYKESDDDDDGSSDSDNWEHDKPVPKRMQTAKMKANSKSQPSTARPRSSRHRSDTVSYAENRDSDNSDSDVKLPYKEKKTEVKSKSALSKSSKTGRQVKKDKPDGRKSSQSDDDDVQVLLELPKNGQETVSKMKNTPPSSIAESIKKQVRKTSPIKRMGTEGKRRSGRNIPVKQYKEDEGSDSELGATKSPH